MSATAVIACGALAMHVRQIARRRGWDVDVHPVPALLHNRPDRIAGAVERQVALLAGDYDRVAVAYADCGTYGELDAVLARTGVRRLPGDHCYDVFARDDVRAALEEEPGTYVLTDFLARTFEHTVWRELGLDRHPSLRDEYFGNYTRVLWLAQRPTPATRAAAERAAAALGLPLEQRDVGDGGLERALEAVVAATSSEPGGPPSTDVDRDVAGNVGPHDRPGLTPTSPVRRCLAPDHGAPASPAAV